MKTALSAAAIALLSTSFAATAVVTLTTAARAAVITQTFTFDTIVGTSHKSATSFVNFFNSALGALDSWSLSGTVTATFSNGGIDDNNLAEYALHAGPIIPDEFLASRRGNGSSSAPLTDDSTVSNLDAVIGTGTFLPYHLRHR